MSDYIKTIKNYHPCNEQEARDKELILQAIKCFPNHLFRESLSAHMTSSAIVINESKTKVLFAYHNIYDSWGWLGGHNDGDTDFLKVAIKEAKEESGIIDVKPYSHDVFMLDVIYVSNHIKHGIYIPDHLHLNLTYLLIADENQTITFKKDENQAVAWFKLDEVFEKITEPRMVPIYQKAFDKIKQLDVL